MAGTAVPGRLTPARLPWRLADVVAVHDETPSLRTLALRIPGWPGHRPGQHLDIRLTAPDGYRAQRSYSIATPAAGEHVEVGVERLDDG